MVHKGFSALDTSSSSSLYRSSIWHSRNTRHHTQPDSAQSTKCATSLIQTSTSRLLSLAIARDFFTKAERRDIRNAADDNTPTMYSGAYIPRPIPSILQLVQLFDYEVINVRPSFRPQVRSKAVPRLSEMVESRVHSSKCSLFLRLPYTPDTEPPALLTIQHHTFHS